MPKVAHIKHQMRESANVDARPEQVRKAKEIKETYYKDAIVTEYNVPFVAKIDIANTTKKIAWFLNGQYHESRKQTLKDQAQYEKLKKLGWKIRVLWYWDDFTKENEI